MKVIFLDGLHKGEEIEMGGSIYPGREIRFPLPIKPKLFDDITTPLDVDPTRCSVYVIRDWIGKTAYAEFVRIEK